MLRCTKFNISSSGVKTEDGEWQTKGHSDRVITITLKDLESLRRVFEDERTPANEVRLPQIHGRQILSVLEKIDPQI